jgi:RimJ/RimL family protein N-acetyltransferase
MPDFGYSPGERALSSPALQLATLYETDDSGRLTTTREPAKQPAPKFVLIRSATASVWGIRTDIPDALAQELTALARDEPRVTNLKDLPTHVERYRALGTTEHFGPAFEFPESVTSSGDIVIVEDERALNLNFRGWVPGEIAAGCGPVIGIVADGQPVSICFCARRSDVAAEAGVDTAPAYRGRGYAGHVTSAWASALRASGRIPLYSTSWTNTASLAVARKLGLVAYANTWSIG